MSVLDIGDELPALRIELSNEFVAEFAREAAMDFGRFTDPEEAKAEGLPGQICPGNMSVALISRALLRWRPNLSLRRLGTTFRGLIVLPQTVQIRGNVTEREERPDGSATIECDVWIEGPEGDRLVVGTAALEERSG